MRQRKAINVRVGENIQNARYHARYTQEQLSEILDITPNHLSEIERGLSGATIPLIEKLCRLFGVSADSLLFGGAREEEFAQEIARLVCHVKPAFQPQIRKAVVAMLEIIEIQEKKNREGNSL